MSIKQEKKIKAEIDKKQKELSQAKTLEEKEAIRRSLPKITYSAL